MTQIWHDNGDGWKPLDATGYANEQQLHDLVADAPGLLPLAGAPEVIVLGTEVRLGSGRIDILAVESTGRPVLIEIKLQANPEARRAVVAQVLAYAAFLQGLTVRDLDQLLAVELGRFSSSTVSDAVRSAAQSEAVDVAQFEDSLGGALAAGGFRLVIVLDDVPTELVRLVGYLQLMAPDLVIDLLVVKSYDVGGSRVLVPQRVESLRTASPTDEPRVTGTTRVVRASERTPGATAFRESASGAKDEQLLLAAADWAEALAARGLTRLDTNFGARGEVTLRLLLPGRDGGMVTVWNWMGDAIVSFWETTISRFAPDSVAGIQAAIGRDAIGQGTTSALTENLMLVIGAAYEEAGARRGG